MVFYYNVKKELKSVELGVPEKWEMEDVVVFLNSQGIYPDDRLVFGIIK